METDSKFLIDEENVHCGALSCRGCGWSLLARHISSVMGTKTVYVVPACCFSIIAGPYPMNMLKGTVVHTLFAAAAATATGIRHSLDRQGKTDSPVVILAGDGGTFDIGLQALSGAAARNENILFICNNNGAYMNTGVQSSTATPIGALTTTNPLGKNTNAKDLMGIIAAHKLPYFATASLAYLGDLKNKMEKAKAVEGFRFIMIDSPCPPGHKYAPELSIEISRLAVETNYFPLFEVDNGTYKLNHFPDKKIPVGELLKQQGRFAHLFKKDASALMDTYQKEVDEQWTSLLEKIHPNTQSHNITNEKINNYSLHGAMRTSDTVGKTPLLKLSDKLYAKFEAFNPSGSIKDRIARYIINDAEKNHLIKKGDTIIEATSGNTGIALACVGAERGYKVKIVMPCNMSEERKQMMRLFGAEIIEVEAGDFDGAIQMRDELAHQNGWFNPNQFLNPLNIECHEKTTAVEILDQVSNLGDISALVLGTGTGGTMMGIRKTLIKHYPNMKVIALEPAESPVMSGGEHGTHGIQGIGDGSRFLVDLNVLDEILLVTTDEAKQRARSLIKENGIFVGFSSGANVLAAERWIEKNNPTGIVVTVLSDRAERYLSLLN